MYNKIVFASFFVILLPSIALAQELSVGIKAGNLRVAQAGFAQMDSVAVLVNPQNRNHPQIALYIDYQVNPRLGVRADLARQEGRSSFMVANTLEECLFCPVMKVTAISQNSTELSLYPYWNTFVWDDWKVQIHGGGTLTFQQNEEQEDSHFNGRHPAVADVVNELDQSLAPYFTSYTVGGTVWYQGFNLSVEYQAALTSFLQPVVVNGIRYPLSGDMKSIQITLGWTPKWLRWELPKKEE